jgi:hypothetical protein
MWKPKVEKREMWRPLCPLAGFKECMGKQCMIWDDDWQICSLNNESLYSMVRAAVCDAAVEIAGAEGARATRTSSVSAEAADTFPRGEGWEGGDEPRYPLPPLGGGGLA